MIRILAALLCLLPAIALASDFPARYSVNGVSANDTLNIRAEPNARASKLGEYPPFAINVEILRVSEDGKWGMVGLGEGNGWVSMRFLQTRPAADPYRIPRPFACSGTEPFWTLNMAPRGAEFTELGFERVDLNEETEAVAQRGYLATFSEGPTKTYTLLADRAQCGDGMSDREFGFTSRIFIEAPDGNRYLRGCCTMEPVR